MRKLIVVMLLIFCTALSMAINIPSAPNVLDEAQLGYFMELPASLQEDLFYAQNSEETQLTITLSHQEFFYEESISVSIEASNPEARIFYTLDGSMPSSGSESYAGPLSLENLGGGSIASS
jgi:hypothetical protein